MFINLCPYGIAALGKTFCKDLLNQNKNGEYITHDECESFGVYKPSVYAFNSWYDPSEGVLEYLCCCCPTIL